MYDNQSEDSGITQQHTDPASTATPLPLLPHETAAIWLFNKYSREAHTLSPEKNVKKNLLEALHHSCQAGDMKRSGEILALRLEGQATGYLFDRLRTWGWYEDIIEACNELILCLDSKILDVGNYHPNWIFFCMKSLGDVYLAQGEYAKGLGCFNKCLEIATDGLNNKQALRTILDGIGSCYRILGNYKESIGYYNQCLDLSHEDSDHIGESNSLGNLGAVYLDMGAYDEARSYFKRSLRIARETGNRQSEGNALGHLANLDELLGSHDAARERYKLYLDVATEIGDSQGQANALNGLGNVLLAEGKPEKAIAEYNRCIEISKRIENWQIMVTAYGSRGNANLRLRNYEAALEDHAKCLTISRRIGDRRGQCRALEGTGSALLLLKKNTEALEALKEGKAIAEELGDARLEARLSTRLGAAYYQNGEVVAAENCNLSALSLLDAAENIGTRRDALSNLGEIHYSSKDFIKAEEYLKEYTALSTSDANSVVERRYLGMLGHTYLSLKKYEEAEEILRDVLRDRHEDHNMAETAGNLANLAEACYAQSKYGDALAVFDEYTEFVVDRPELVSADSAAGMCNLALHFLSCREHDRAIQAAKGSVMLYECIIDRDKNGSSWTGYAVALNALATAFHALKNDAQRRLIEEKLRNAFDHAYAVLLTRDDESDTSVLALALNNASNRISFFEGMEVKALSLAEKAVELLQWLDEKDHRKYGPSLAVSLHNLSRRKRQVGKTDDARQLAESSLSMLRPFYENDPEKYSEWMKQMEEA